MAHRAGGEHFVAQALVPRCANEGAQPTIGIEIEHRPALIWIGERKPLIEPGLRLLALPKREDIGDRTPFLLDVGVRSL